MSEAKAVLVVTVEVDPAGIHQPEDRVGEERLTERGRLEHRDVMPSRGGHASYRSHRSAPAQCSSTGAAIGASVATKESIVAMSGAIMPAPLAMPPMVNEPSGAAVPAPTSRVPEVSDVRPVPP